MDYEKKYKEALELMKDCIPDKDGLVHIRPCEIFPELKESEDERIRKAIIKMVSDIAGGFPFEKYGIQKKEALTWLEKQGEQKANEIHPIFRVGDYIRNKKTSDEVLIEQLDVKAKDYYYTSYDGGAEIHSDFPFSKQDEWELIGQKSVEHKPTWSEEDGVMLDEIIDFFENGTVKLQHDLSLYASWLKSLKERYTWKPSDEQMEALYTYIYNPQYFNSPDQRMELVESVYKDLKKLREE